MSSAEKTLPSHLSFEQLRKQAKELLKERKAAGEALQLKDAQRLLALRYGLSTWAELKNRAEGNERVIALKESLGNRLELFGGGTFFNPFVPAPGNGGR